MDKYNPDLIFDLAAGLLPDDEARAAEAGLTAEGRAELAAQRAVLAAIAAEPDVAMNDIERAQLHRSVADGIAAITREMSPVEVARPQAATRPTRSVRWMRWASAATAAAMFVGVVAVGSQLSIGGSDSASDTTVANADAQALRESSATTVAGAALTTTTVSFEAAAGSDGAMEDAGFLEAPPVRDDANSSDLDQVDEFVQEALETQRLDPFSLRSTNPTQLSCYAEASQENVVLLGFFAPYEGPDGEIIDAVGYAFEGVDPEDPPYTYYRPDTCEPILSNTE